MIHDEVVCFRDYYWSWICCNRLFRVDPFLTRLACDAFDVFQTGSSAIATWCLHFSKFLGFVVCVSGEIFSVEVAKIVELLLLYMPYLGFREHDRTSSLASEQGILTGIKKYVRTMPSVILTEGHFATNLPGSAWQLPLNIVQDPSEVVTSEQINNICCAI